MNSMGEKLLVVESDDGLRNQIASLLRDVGYDVATDDQEGKAVLGFNPDLVIRGADPERWIIACNRCL